MLTHHTLLVKYSEEKVVLQLLVAVAVTPATAFLLLRSTGFLTIQQGPMGLLFTPDLLPLPQATAAAAAVRHAATTARR